MNKFHDSKFSPRVFRVDMNTECIKHRSDWKNPNPPTWHKVQMVTIYIRTGHWNSFFLLLSGKILNNIYVVVGILLILGLRTKNMYLRTLYRFEDNTTHHLRISSKFARSKKNKCASKLWIRIIIDRVFK